jgi:hypothetical protein
LYLVSGDALISGFTDGQDSSATYACYEDPYCDEDDPANATPPDFPTGAVVFVTLGSIAGTACLWVWIVSKGVETGGSALPGRKDG